MPSTLLRRSDEWTAYLASSYGYVGTRDVRLHLVRNALITRATYPSPEQFTGAVYDTERRLIRSSLRLDPDADQPIDPETVPESRYTSARRVPRAIYGGMLFLILGHFLFESAARLWLQIDFSQNFNKGEPVPVIFHPSRDFELGVFGSYPLFRDSLAALSVRLRNLLLADEDFRVDVLYYPEPLSIYHEYVHPLMGRVIDHLIAELKRPRTLAARWSSRLKTPAQPRIYLSRSRWHENHRIANEYELENVFRERGFAIVHPQELAPHDVIRVMQGADLIASSDGSHAHLLAFARRGTRSLLLDTRPVPTQTAIEKLRELDALHVPIWQDSEGIWDQESKKVRLDEFSAFLNAYLSSIPA
ncbi:glycosyltransferase family 61 protein [Methylobacterium sp. C25]|uniref:glycosyltransferase 61 family protein n=1 Tax=Methylobacterium sp. C25 TaxID=2721622 RepID=UPI001F3DE233|nr:glycosyltransferase family 61 protein [Methylobacterium sp. C25]MCE4225975.1 glycosyltransferase family 61 protein [Methylobacterium sp. C25]